MATSAPGRASTPPARRPRDDSTATNPARGPVRPQQRFYQQPYRAPGDEARPSRGDAAVARTPGRQDARAGHPAGNVPPGQCLRGFSGRSARSRAGRRNDRYRTPEACTWDSTASRRPAMREICQPLSSAATAAITSSTSVMPAAYHGARSRCEILRNPPIRALRMAGPLQSAMGGPTRQGDCWRSPTAARTWSRSGRRAA